MIIIKKGDFYIIEYTGKMEDKIIDTTDEKVAKKNGLFSPNVRYGPKTIVYGYGQIIPGIEEAVEKMKIGEEKTIDIKAEKAFGKRRKNAMRIIRLSDFSPNERRKIVPGATITIPKLNLSGRVRSVSSGRVMIDFNHPLAGHDLQYTIKLIKIIEDDEKKVEQFLNENNIKADVQKQEDLFKIKILDNELVKEKKQAIETLFQQFLNGKRVVFVE